MRAKLCIWSMALVMALALVGCEGSGNNPDNPQVETSDAKLLGKNGAIYEVEMKDGTHLYFRKTRDYTDTPYYFSLTNASAFYAGHSQEAELTAKYAYKGMLTIPASVKIDMGNGSHETYTVEAIDKWTCAGMDISGVSFPYTIKEIGEYAFIRCSSLETIEIPNGITDLLYTFRGCKSLKSITLPKSLTKLNGAVDSCLSLATIELPSNLSVLSIYCSSIKTIDLPSDLSRLSIIDFTSLEAIELPNNLEYLGLANAPLLKTLSIPQSVTHIDGFYGCSDLKEVKCYAVEPPFLTELYLDVTLKFTLYVPRESITRYQEDNTWKKYIAQILALEDETPDTPDEPTSDCNNIQASYLTTGGSGLGDVKEQLVTGAKSWFYDAQYGARVSKSNTEAWLYTPEYNMSGMASVQVSFQHAINYAGDMQTQQTMWVTDNFTGDVTTTNWQQLTIPNYPAGNNWTFVSNTVNVPIQYVGEKTVIAFKYTSGGSGNTATWEIKNLTINAVCANK